MANLLCQGISSVRGVARNAAERQEWLSPLLRNLGIRSDPVSTAAAQALSIGPVTRTIMVARVKSQDFATFAHRLPWG